MNKIRYFVKRQNVTLGQLQNDKLFFNKTENIQTYYKKDLYFGRQIGK